MITQWKLVFFEWKETKEMSSIIVTAYCFESFPLLVQEKRGHGWSQPYSLSYGHKDECEIFEARVWRIQCVPDWEFSLLVLLICHPTQFFPTGFLLRMSADIIGSLFYIWVSVTFNSFITVCLSRISQFFYYLESIELFEV